MQPEIANHIHGVLSYGLRLKERLERGETPNFMDEQAALKGRLLSEVEATRWTEYSGDRSVANSSVMGGPRSMDSAIRRSADTFLGIRYALVCWLDEIFIVDSPWAREWNEFKLESALYGTNDRAFGFWDQARRAEARQGTDALEVFYLCVMLGFRGDYREYPEKLQAWHSATRDRIVRGLGQEFHQPPEVQAPTHVPPRRAMERLRRMLLIAGGFTLVAIGVVVFFVVRGASQ